MPSDVGVHGIKTRPPKDVIIYEYIIQTEQMFKGSQGTWLRLKLCAWSCEVT